MLEEIGGEQPSGRRSIRYLSSQQHDFRSLAEHSPDLIARFDRDLRHLYVNPAVEKATGIPREQFLGKTNRVLGMPSELGDSWDPALRQVFETGNEAVIEFAFPTPHGVRHYESRIVPEFAADGTVPSVLGVTRDITEHKETEEALQQSETWFRALLENSYDATAVVDAEGVFTYVEESIRQVLGYSPADLHGTNGFGLVHPEDLEGIQAAFFQLLQSPKGATKVAFRARHADGSWRWLDLKGVNRLDDSRIGGIVVNFRDVTERKQAEEALHAKQAQLEAELVARKQLQEVSTQLIYEDRIDVLYHRILDASVAIMGSDAATMQWLHADRHQLQLLAAKGLEATTRAAWEWIPKDAAAASAAAWRTRNRVIVPNVENCDFMVGTSDLDTYRQSGIRAVQSTPLVSRSGRLLGMISTHWLQPHQPTEHDFHLLDLLARQAADLIERTRAEAALREADRQKDEFLAVLAHELRNPLASIAAAGELMSLAEPPDPDIIQESRDIIVRQAGHMKRLLDDLLDVARLTRGQITLQKESLEAASIMEQAVEMARYIIDERRHHLTVTAPEATIRLEGDLTRLAQIVSNLLTNAAKYTPEGGQIGLRAEASETEVAFRVCDNGQGIAPERLPSLFQTFSRVSTTGSEGLGMGLVLVRSLVELHGGQVEAHSEGLGKGSEFVVRVPRLNESPQQERPGLGSGDAEQQASSQQRVLIVEDQDELLRMTAKLLQRAGYEVETASDGQTALKVGRSFCPYAVLLDIGLPDMNGLEVARQMREQPETQKARIIALSGYGQEQDIQRSKEAGCDGHLIKPATVKAIKEILESTA